MNILDKFDLNAKLPVDSRAVCTHKEDIPLNSRYHGMITFETNSMKQYVWDDINGVFTDLQNYVNALISEHTAILKNVGVDFEQKGGIPNDSSTGAMESNRALMQSLQDSMTTLGGTIRINKKFYFGQSGSSEYSVISRDNVNVIGINSKAELAIAGVGKQYCLFWYKPANFTVDTPLQNVNYSNFKVNGYELDVGTYTHKGKAFYFQNIKNGYFEKLELYGLPSTALGIDFLRNVHINDIHCVECGRQWEEAWTNGGTRPAELGPGGAGVGIGTGLFDDENFVIDHVVAEGCGHYGVFLEHQALFDSATFNKMARGITISNCTAINGRFGGLGLRGAQNTVVSNFISYGNKHGMFNDSKNNASSVVKFMNVKFENCEFTNNTNLGGYVIGIENENMSIVNCTFSNNGGEGLVIGRDAYGTYVIRGLTLLGNTIKSNGSHGLTLDAGISASGLTIADNKCSFNGGHGFYDNISVSNGGYKDNYFLDNTGDGMHLTGNKKYLDIFGNTAQDNQTTKTQNYGFFYDGLGQTMTNSNIKFNNFKNNGVKSMSMVASSVDASTTIVRFNETDDNGMLRGGLDSYVSFPKECADFVGKSLINIRVKVRFNSFDTGASVVKALIFSHSKDGTVTTSPQGYWLYLDANYKLTLEVRGADLGTTYMRTGTTVFQLGTTYDILVNLSSGNVALNVNGVDEVMTVTTGTNAEIFGAFQSAYTTFPFYLKGGYYNGVMKAYYSADIMTLKRYTGLTDFEFEFKNYGVNRAVYDNVFGYVGNGYKGVKQVDNFNPS